MFSRCFFCWLPFSTEGKARSSRSASAGSTSNLSSISITAACYGWVAARLQAQRPARRKSRKRKVKSACKPGSVEDSHSSRPAVTDWLKQPTRRLSEQRQRLPIWSCSGWRLPRFTLDDANGRLSPPAGRQDSSLWPYSSPHGGRPLTGILLYGARTFLPPPCGRQRLSS